MYVARGESEEHVGALHCIHVLHTAMREKMQQMRGTLMCFAQGIVDLAVK
jgi:hypothetical protein